MAVAVATGAVAATAFAILFLVYQLRRFRTASAVVPELYEEDGPGLPGWA